MQGPFYSKILIPSPEKEEESQVKLVFNRYSDSFLVLLTQRDKFGSFVISALFQIQIIRGDDDEIDVKLLSGASKYADLYLEIARTLAEIWVGNPSKILGITGKKALDIYKSRTNKKIIFNLCLNLSSSEDYTSEEDELFLKGLYSAWKDFVLENVNNFQ